MCHACLLAEYNLHPWSFSLLGALVCNVGVRCISVLHIRPINISMQTAYEAGLSKFALRRRMQLSFHTQSIQQTNNKSGIVCLL